ncbi:response regulator transcription factor [Mesobacillus maritimus]|uniref:Response regulator n=1 Tax=Mesobacillus maritimus TaxID=1643336 RepID=A0ABS7K6M9_9BACI|nr:response regulator [Mesobacillus maritimus]MBY0097885.1 response regulator [Mesobacillus maritimus]
MRILIVEDEVRISNLLRMYLKRESFQVDVAENGDDGLNLAIQEVYDLIILDIFLPGKDGFMVLEELRKHNNTPVLFLSAQNAANDQKRGHDLGASGFISKPFSPGEVVSKVKDVLEQTKIAEHPSE